MCSSSLHPSLHPSPHPSKVGNGLVKPLVLRLSMGGGNRLASGDMSARLPISSIQVKKKSEKIYL